MLASLLALIVGGWLIANVLDDEQVKPKALSSPGSWQEQLVKRAALISPRGPDSQSWPFAAMKDEPESMPQRRIQDANSTLGRGHRALGLRFDQSQYVDTSAGIGIWVVRGKGITCIFHARTVAAACNTDAEAGRRGLALVVGEGRSASPRALPPRFLALGIAPNSTQAVELRTAGGASETIPVIDNAFALRAREPMNLQELIG